MPPPRSLCQFFYSIMYSRYLSQPNRYLQSIAWSWFAALNGLTLIFSYSFFFFFFYRSPLQKTERTIWPWSTASASIWLKCCWIDALPQVLQPMYQTKYNTFRPSITLPPPPQKKPGIFLQPCLFSWDYLAVQCFSKTYEKPQQDVLTFANCCCGCSCGCYFCCCYFK